MTLKDISSGPDWVGYAAVIILVVVACILLLGHGSWMIAGYNTASKEKKAQYSKKRLCRITGGGMLVMAVCAGIMVWFENILPAYTATIFAGIVIADVALTLVLMNTLGKKRENEDEGENDW